jgi:hypothetical protein
LYAVNASSAAHIQVMVILPSPPCLLKTSKAGVNFARDHNLKVAIKASGHDLLGRSTAKGSLLLWTHYFQDITFHQSFKVGDKDMGESVTVGSGVSLRMLYEATKARGKIFVGGAAQEVVLAGGYLQGAGHSPLSPKYGLAADNVLGMYYYIVLFPHGRNFSYPIEFSVVLANGQLVTVNEGSHPDRK